MRPFFLQCGGLSSCRENAAQCPSDEHADGGGRYQVYLIVHLLSIGISRTVICVINQLKSWAKEMSRTTRPVVYCPQHISVEEQSFKGSNKNEMSPSERRQEYVLLIKTEGNRRPVVDQAVANLKLYPVLRKCLIVDKWLFVSKSVIYFDVVIIQNRYQIIRYQTFTSHMNLDEWLRVRVRLKVRVGEKE